MDRKEWLKKPMGIPVDPAKQKDPEAAGDEVPAEGRAEFLNSMDDQRGGQRTEVGSPYNGAGNERGLPDTYTGGDETRKKLEDDSIPPERKLYGNKKDE
ncbi:MULTISPECIES: hypothetical protein [Myxococcaceae]|uniref:hypothetical protein n=1 Tax=Myxococcaceae TaxID=31 RepID=UPI00188F6F48|nr:MULTISPECIES: hypothetical protein [Myxococcaceae]MBF5046260.1 hypothetical protein [Simulacricoccus sp. 17bor-14]